MISLFNYTAFSRGQMKSLLFTLNELILFEDRFVIGTLHDLSESSL